MSTPYTPADEGATQAIPAYTAGPGFAQQAATQGFAQEQVRTPGPSADFTQRAQAAQPDGTPQYTSNGFSAEERAQRARGHGPVYNWFTTGDKTLSLDSEQGKALAPPVADGWSVAGLICAFFVPLAGLVLSMVAFADAKKNHRRVHGTAIGGFVVGALGSIAWTLYWVVVIVAFAALTNAVNSNPYGG
jgi:hypothetical protein